MNEKTDKRAKKATDNTADDLSEEEAQAIWDRMDDAQRGELCDYVLPGYRRLMLKCLTLALFEVRPEDTVQKVFTLAGRKCREELEQRGSPRLAALEAE